MTLQLDDDSKHGHPTRDSLFNHFSNLTCTYGTATFANRETKTFFHCDWAQQFHGQSNVIARHYHFYSFRQGAITSYVRSTEVELWAVTFEKWSVTATFFFAQYINFTLEFKVRVYRTWLANNHTTTDGFFVDTTQEDTGVVTSFTAVKQLAEHFYTRYRRFQWFFAFFLHTDDLNWITNVDNATLNTASSNSTTTSD